MTLATTAAMATTTAEGTLIRESRGANGIYGCVGCVSCVDENIRIIDGSATIPR